MTDSAHYTVLARRFRPQQFDDVIGQEHIAQALQNAIRGGRVAHAYLFTGARGVGKTSTARILAKALNCPQSHDAIPCNECEVCQSISAGHDVDVLEIDGASNRRIDDIRDIRANVSVKSMRSRYKVYIIDEVHMLTTEAFNALLKTLEEPPPNVKFVFCTTEPGKVPDTILSRCQRFDFSTIETQNISDRLKQIADAEGYSVEADALDLVARRAAGSMRDSQSLFDQLLAFGEKNLAAADVHRLLGTADDQRLIDIYEAATTRDPRRMFELLDETLSAGVQLSELMGQLLSYARDLMIVASGALKVPLQSVFETNREVLSSQAARWGLETIVTGMQILSEAKLQMGRSVNARPIAELALIRICQLGDLKSLVSALRQIESGMPLTMASPQPSPRPESVLPEKKNENLIPQNVSSNDVTDNSVSTSPAQEGLAPGEERGSRPTDTVSSPAREEPPPAPEIPVEADAATRLELSEGSREEFWSRVLSHIDEKIKAHLNSCSSAAIVGPNLLELIFPVEYDLSRRYCEKPDNLKVIESTASRLAGRAIQVRLSVGRDLSGSERERSLEDHPSQPVQNRSVPDLDSVDDDYVRQTAEIFGASLVKVQSLGKTPPAGEG